MDWSTPGFPVFHHLLQLAQTFTESSFRIWNISTGIPSPPLALFIVMLPKAHLKLWAMLCRATQDGQVMVESSDKAWFTEEGNGKQLQCSCLENPMNSMKRQKSYNTEKWTPRFVGAQYAPEEEWRNNSRKNEETEPKQKQHQVVDVMGDGSKVWCCKEQYCLGTWNVRSINQSKLELVKQEMTRVSADILEIRELKWTGMGVHAHSCPILCDPMDCSLPSSSVHGIFQARILMWIAISLSRGSSQPRYQTQVPWVFCIGRQFLYLFPTWSYLEAKKAFSLGGCCVIPYCSRGNAVRRFAFLGLRKGCCHLGEFLKREDFP